jgi:hypothetical protein
MPRATLGKAEPTEPRPAYGLAVSVSPTAEGSTPPGCCTHGRQRWLKGGAEPCQGKNTVTPYLRHRGRGFFHFRWGVGYFRRSRARGESNLRKSGAPCARAAPKTTSALRMQSLTKFGTGRFPCLVAGFEISVAGFELGSWRVLRNSGARLT